MIIVKDAIAGTLESSDVLVRVSPHPSLEVTINSAVAAQYGDAIEATVADTLQRLEVTAGLIEVDDKGALDCTLRARVEAAVARASEASIDWSTL
jgi:citrate lyase subunit gamma (acyl carrier protein)